MNTLATREYAIPFLWGLILLISWIGWGEIVRRLFGLKTLRVDWGLAAAWGMAFMLALGGWLAVVSLCNQSVLLGMVFIGAAVWAISLYARLRDRPYARRRLMVRLRPRRFVWYLPVLIVLIFLYACSVYAKDVNWWDDLPSYFVFVERLLQTGTIIDPFSWRRISTYGGQQMFDAIVFSGASYFNADILELGLARVVFTGLLLGMVRRLRWGGERIGKGARRQWQRAVPPLMIVLFLLIPVPRLNTQSQMTGVVLFLALLRTLHLLTRSRTPLRIAVLVGMIAAGVSTLRMTFVPSAVLCIALAFFVRLLLQRREWKRHIASFVTITAVFIFTLLPWSIVLYFSSRSLFYPLMKGTERPEFTLVSAGLTPSEKVHFLANFILQPALLVLIAPGLLLLSRRYWKTELPLYLAGLITMAVIVLSFTRANFLSLFRYSFPPLFAVSCALLLTAMLRSRSRPALIAATLLTLLTAVFNVPGSVDWLVHDRWLALSDSRSDLALIPQAIPEYRAAQDSIPKGQKFLACVSFPSILDFTRNPIVSIDCPGAASPDPGMPLFQGGAAVKAYLKNLGIDYIMLVDPNRDLTVFSRKVFATTHSPEFDFTRPFTLKFFDDMDELNASEETIFVDKNIHVLHLK